MVDMGESLRELSEVKDAFDLNVKQNFLDPLDHLKNKDLKEINVSVIFPTYTIQTTLCYTNWTSTVQ